MNPGTYTINGHVVVISVDSTTGVTAISFPEIHDQFGNELVITISPMEAPGDIERIVNALVTLLFP